MKFNVFIFLFLLSLPLQSVYAESFDEWTTPTKVDSVEIYKKSIFILGDFELNSHSPCGGVKLTRLIKLKSLNEKFVDRSLTLVLAAKMGQSNISFNIVSCNNKYMEASAVKII